MSKTSRSFMIAVQMMFSEKYTLAPKLLAAPAIIVVILGFAVLDITIFLWRKMHILVPVIILAFLLSGCWGAPYQNLYYQQATVNAQQAQAEAQRQANWQTQQIQNRKPACTYNSCN